MTCTTAGILVKNGTQRCQIYNNYVHHNWVGVYLRNDGDKLTEGNVIHDNSLVYNQQAIVWRDDGLWNTNVTANNRLGWGARLRWGDTVGSAAEFLAATGVDAGR